ncbi:MAG: SRPBCC family protein [Microthrixaceae bacterium]
MKSVRRERLMRHPASDVWSVVGDPESLARWFPGIVECTYASSDEPGVVGTRSVTTQAGLSLSEEIITLDPLLRRLQYRIAGGVLRHHLATVDVIAVDDSSCLAIYGTDAEPDVMALILGGAAGEGLENIEAILDRNSTVRNED